MMMNPFMLGGKTPEELQMAYDPMGQLGHFVDKKTSDGIAYKAFRPMAMTLEEARQKSFDYYHPTFGWIWNGVKLARDRVPQELMADRSEGGMPPGYLPVTSMQDIPGMRVESEIA